MIIYPAKSSAQVGVRVNSVLTVMAALNYIYCCLKNSFCNNWMHSKLKSKVPLRNCAFKASRGNPSKVVKLPIMSPGAENMKYLNNT